MTYRESAQKKAGSEVKTFTIPFTSENIKENITITTNSPPKDSKDQIINQAITLHRQGNISEATKYYQHCINQGYEDERIFSNYASILTDLGKLKEAELSLRKAIELNPNYSNGYYNLGSILLSLGKLKEAELITRKSIELNPDFASSHLNLGYILKAFRNLKGAEISYRKAIELNPDFADAHSNLGSILNDLGNLKEAEKTFRKVIELKANNAKAYCNLGCILSEIGEAKEAESSLRKAIELDPNYETAYLNLGSVLREIGELKEAEIYTRKAIKINPILAEAYANLGEILIDFGRNKEAIQNWIKAVELKPEITKSVISLANNLCSIDQYELALKYLIKNKSNSCQSLYLGCLLSLDRKKDFDEKYKDLYEKKACNAEIGGIVAHANIIYGEKYESTFCNEAIKYISIEKIDETLFSEKHLKDLISYNKTSRTENKSQKLLNNGVQSSGNLFLLDYPFIKSIKNALEIKIKNYKQKFKDSGQGFINNWPENYELRSWMISMKTGGFLNPHNHEYGWITGSFYLKMPKYNKNDDSGKIAFSYKGPRYPDKDKNFNLTIKKIETRDICIFPSSLFHHTIPFKSSEERICFVFDLV